MNFLNKYNTFCKKRQTTILLVIVFAIVAVLAISSCRADDGMITCWVMCIPNDTKDGGHYVNARIAPSTKSRAMGRLENGDSFKTDATSKDGFLRAYGIGENGEAWIYSGFVVTEEPEIINEQYVCVSNARVAIRRWMNGPRVAGASWLTNGSNVFVYAIADGWACTNRGYIMAEYLEVDPQ